MAKRNLTEGARRAVESARSHARSWQHPELLPAHLLWALLDEESQAYELLTDSGVKQPLLREQDIWRGLAPAIDESTPPPEHSDTDDALEALTREVAAALGTNAADDVARESDGVRRALDQAQLFAKREGRDVDVSSEHLLASLFEADPALCLCLESFGLSPSLFSFVTQPVDAFAEPMPVSFQIDQTAQSPGERAAVFRILDAAANRAREGLRVVEDFVRFGLDDTHLSRLLKNARHRLGDVMQDVDLPTLIAARETQRDVGTRISTVAEQTRTSPLDAAQASLKRIQEAVRTLEEYSKALPGKRDSTELPSLPERFEQLRYELYTIEKAVLTTVGAQQCLDRRNVYLLITAEQCEQDVDCVLHDAISAGVRIVQIREKSMNDRKLLDYAEHVRGITRKSGTLLIMNDRPDLAVLCDADGVHLGQEELTVHDARQIVGPHRLVGVSTHSIEQARQAVLDGASYIGVGPVFPSRTKSFDEHVGLDLVAEVSSEISLPWYPIGGIDRSHLDQLLDAGASRIAVSGAICRSPDPGHAAAELVAKLRSN